MGKNMGLSLSYILDGSVHKHKPLSPRNFGRFRVESGAGFAP